MDERLSRHLETIRKHRKAVCKWCFIMKIPMRGILHDLSKYSLTELSIYSHYTGKRSPHDVARESIGYSPSWYHHRNRNKHHWEYWVDEYELRTAVKIPYKYVVEMFCDFIGAGQVYSGDRWSESSPLNYHLKLKSKKIMHPDSLYLFELLLVKLRDMGCDDFKDWYRNEHEHIKRSYMYSCIRERFKYKI